jgi:uncharacterized secreted protein with C-terminal beta-propeller domain
MKKQTYIARALSFFVLGLVMILSIFGKQIADNQRLKADSKPKTEKKSSEPSQTTISEWSMEVLVPSHAFDFNEAVFIFPTQHIAIVAVEQVFKLITKPIFRLSFFEKLFELHIAINAP